MSDSTLYNVGLSVEPHLNSRLQNYRNYANGCQGESLGMLAVAMVDN